MNYTPQHVLPVHDIICGTIRPEHSHETALALANKLNDRGLLVTPEIQAVLDVAVRDVGRGAEWWQFDLEDAVNAYLASVEHVPL